MKCGADQYLKMLQEENPQYKELLKKIEDSYRQNILRHNSSTRSSIISLPVVVHIIHNNGPENVSDAQVIQGISDLNDAFRNLGYYNPNTGVDTDIEFCLAQRDTSGKEINGIVRHQSIYTDMSLSGSGSQVKSLATYNRKAYINIRLVRNCCLGGDCNTAGYAGLGGGIVMKASYFGTSPQKSTTTAHEMGHALGLAHTFQGGCKNNNCLTDGDKVCDTPPDNMTFDHCIFGGNSCSSDEDDTTINNPYRPISMGGLGDQDDMNSNYLDYNFSECRDQFTQGQKKRMQFFIGSYYEELLSSKSCLPPCEDLVISDFELPDSVEVGGTLLVANQSINADSYQWFVNGNPVSTTLDYTHTFLDTGTIAVQLEAYTNDTLCETSTMVKPIIVYCPVEACFDYTINGQYLILDDCSTNATVLEFIVINDKDTIFTTSQSLDSVYVNNIDFIKVCLTARGEHCSDVHCKYITITSNGSEICNNELDDDGDGLIDLFDPDCPCNAIAYQAQCPTDCPYILDSFPDFKMKLKWQSEVVGSSNSTFVVGDIDSNGQVDIIASKIDYINNNFYLLNINGLNGERININSIIAENYGTIALANIDKNGGAEIAYSTKNGFNIYSENLSFVLSSEIISSSVYNTLLFSDINQDGSPEIIISNYIFNSTNGKKLIGGMENYGCNFGSEPCTASHSVVADLLPTPGLELAVGGIVYNLELNNLNGELGNIITPNKAVDSVKDGFTSVGDIDVDGQLDVIVVRDNNYVDGGGIWIWNPRNGNIIAQAKAGKMGGVAMIGDVDGDCKPEIAMTFENELRVYQYDGTIDLKLLYSLATTDESGITGVTMFDFNQDGKNEIVYRDETDLRIIEGETGLTLASTPMLSGTVMEYPIIADIDNDGQAEILVSGYITAQEESRIYCFESDGAPWAPARSVWNQYGYNPTFVNDDLTIPRYPQNPAKPLQGTENCEQETCSTPYNNFMVQATYRTQEGCYVWPSAGEDLSITASSMCVGDSIEICFYVTSTDTTTVRNGVTVSCYPPPWVTGTDNPIDIVIITQDTTCIMMPMLIGIDSILIVINDAGGYYPPDFPNTGITECDYTNNAFVLQLGGPDFSIDIIDWECSPDSLIFYIATDNVGLDTDVSCIGGGCYFIPLNGQDEPLEVTSWCFEPDTTTMSYQYQDTFRVAIPHPIGQSQMWWTINEGGFGPGLFSSGVTGIYECNYTNNTDSISFDIGIKTLDLGPDITKCQSEVITFNVGSGFESYLWSDLTTDSIYSSSFEGLHYVEAMDKCGRVYRDTVAIMIDHTDDVNIDDVILCPSEPYNVSLANIYDKVTWYPSENVDCDDCLDVMIQSDTSFQLVVFVEKDNCISIDTSSVTIRPQITLFDEKRICEDEIFYYRDSLLTTSGLYEFAINDCDSIVILEFFINKKDTISYKEFICEGDSILFYNDWLRDDGNYSYIDKNKNNCDSLVRLQLIVDAEIMITDTLKVCLGDSIQVFDEWIKEETLVNKKYTSQAGCDSTQWYQIFVDNLLAEQIDVTICEGDSIYIGNKWLKLAGDFEIQFSNINQCDSLYLVSLKVDNLISKKDTLSICEGDSILIFDQFEKSEGDYSKVFTSVITGCDSLQSYNLKVGSLIEIKDTMSICEGDSIFINDQWLSEAGIYEYISEGINCDELHQVKLDVYEEYSKSIDITLCPNDSIWIDNRWVYDDENIPIQYQTIYGCDSIVISNIYSINSPLMPITVIDCEELEILASIDVSDNWSILWNNGDTLNNTTYKDQEIANVILTSEPDCQVSFDISLPALPNFEDFPNLTDKVVNQNTQIDINLNIDLSEYDIIWSPSGIINCDTCQNISITPTEDVLVELTITHNSGCIYERSFNIYIKKVDILDIPNIFSPNADGINDDWIISMPDDLVIKSLSIYDRWGSKVASWKELQEIKWDGTFNGKNLISGVYIYLMEYLDINGNSIVTKGDITLIR
jgi:gliding motility-associated-like protein